MGVVQVFLALLIWAQATNALTILMNENTTGLLGSNAVDINCSYTLAPGDLVFELYFKILINGSYKSIATFSAFGTPAEYTSEGEFLRNRTNLNNLLVTERKAVFSFTEIVCEDDKSFLCEINYRDGVTNDTPNPLPSASTQLFVRAAAEKPENPPEISGVPDGSIAEGQNVTFTCSGNIGNPPGKFVWEKYRMIGFFPTVYPDEVTMIEPGYANCTYNGTSSVTIQMLDADDRGMVRCVLQQEFGSFIAPSNILNVEYSVRGILVSRTPDQGAYIEGSDPISLFCGSAGNPVPSYAWYAERNNTLLANSSTYIINDVTVENSGNYICVAENTVDGVTYNTSASVSVVIGPNITSTTSAPPVMVTEETGEDNSTMAAVIGGSVGATIALVALGFVIKKACLKKGKYNGSSSQGQINHFETTKASPNVPPSSTQQFNMYDNLYRSESRVSRL